MIAYRLPLSYKFVNDIVDNEHIGPVPHAAVAVVYLVKKLDKARLIWTGGNTLDIPHNVLLAKPGISRVFHIGLSTFQLAVMNADGISHHHAIIRNGGCDLKSCCDVSQRLGAEKSKRSVLCS